MKHTTWKRLLSLLLVAAMVGSFGVTAMATGTGSDVGNVDIWTQPQTVPKITMTATSPRLSRMGAPSS